MPEKRFALNADEIRPLVGNLGACFASDRIMVDGAPVGYMYREQPDFDADSGWRFLAGDESDEYLEQPETIGVYDVNTVANYDPDIIPLLTAPCGSAFARHSSTEPLEAVPPPG